jgi:hypothetical protein
MRFLTLVLLQALVIGRDPFAFFQPTVTVSAPDRSVLERGYPVTRVLPAKGQEDAVFVALPVHIDADRFVAWERRIEELKKGGYVLAVGRFSDPPRIEDLAGLELDRQDIDDIRKCRPGSCQVKLSAKEMTQLREAANQAKGNATEAVQDAFRQVVLARVQLYLTRGQIPPYEDEHVPVQPAARFASLLQHAPFLSQHAPQIVEYLRDYPSAPAAGVESFFYWSKERVVGKAIISVTQVNIVRSQDVGMPDVLVVNRDIYSSHYINGSLSVTALLPGTTGDLNYLAYANQTEVDILHGVLAGFIRKAMHHRVKDDATRVLQTYKQRLEGGPPPSETTTSGTDQNRH